MTLRASRASRVLLALATAGALAACSDDTDAPATTPGGAVSANPFAGDLEPVVHEAAVLEVEDQTSLGANLRVARVAAPDGGFVVISTADGTDTYGIGPVEPTDTPTEIRVALGEDITSGEHQLLARLYADDGDGQFGPEDPPLAASEGNDDGGFAGESDEFTLTLDIPAEDAPAPAAS